MRFKLLSDNNSLHRADFYKEYLKVELSNEVCEVMQSQNISRDELARRMDCSRKKINRILRADDKFTMKTLAKLSMALDYEWDISLVSRKTK